MRISGKFLFLSLIIGQVLFGTNVWAQSDDEIYQGGLEEVIVTAQKRAESLQDVPISISAITGDEILDAGLGDLKALGQREPSVIFENQAKSRPVLTMRGIGQSGASIGQESAVGVFVDGVYVPRMSGAIQSLGNVERVEILKGPQGTLYGRNTIGGALSIYTIKPGNEITGYVEGGIGNRGTWRASGYIEGGLIQDTLAGSLAVTSSHLGGDRTEDFTGAENDSDDNYFRGRLVFAPTDELEFDLIMSYSNEQGEAVLEEPRGGPPIPFTAALAPSPPFPPGTILFSVPLDVQAASVAQSATDFYSNATSEPGLVDIETLLTGFTINWSTDSFDLTAISGFYSSDILTIRDFDGTEFDIVSTNDVSESDSFSQELRFTSVPGGAFTFDDRLEWVLGAFYFTDEADQKFGINLGVHSVFTAFLNGGVPMNDLYHSTLETDSYAVFAQGSYSFTDRLGLTLGLRYSKDDKKFVYRAETDSPGRPIIVVPFVVSDSFSDDSLDPKVALDYQLTDNAMIYGSYSQGYKGGGIQFATPDPRAAATPVLKETVQAWEAGIKSRWIDDRLQLNAAVFTYDYEDMQRGGIVIINGAPVSLFANAAGADINGLELDLKFLAGEALLLEAGYSYLDTEFTDWVFVGEDLSGNQLPLAPEHSYRLAAQYDFDISSWAGAARLDWAWRDEIFYEENNAIPGSKGDSLGLLGAMVRLASSDQRWEFRLYCSNCTDEEYAAFETILGSTGYGVQSTGPRRRLGFNVRYNF